MGASNDDILATAQQVLAGQQELSAKIDKVHTTVFGNGIIRGSLLWEIEVIKGNLEPLEPPKKLRDTLRELLVDVRQIKGVWVRAGAIILAVGQAVTVAYLVIRLGMK